MTETQMLTLAAALVATLFGLLTALVGWTGRRVIDQLERVVERLDQVASELHERINNLDIRLTTVETRCAIEHGDVHMHRRHGE